MKPSQRIIAGAGTALLVANFIGGCASTADHAGATSTAGASRAASSSSTPSTAGAARTAAAFRALESRYGADLGVHAVDTRTGRTVDFDADRRFAFASTYKALAAGVLLRRDTGAQLSQTIHYTAADLVDYSPITEQHLSTGMSLGDIIAAALQYSDNTAANLMLEQLGGPQGLQSALRGLGDTTTNVDRTEPDVNTATPGDPRDTTTAAAIGTDLRAFVLGAALTPARRERLAALMRGNTTGGPYIRAGVPADWTVGDKTGNGGWGTRNDVGVAWLPDGDTVVVSILSDRHTSGASSDDALLADATKAVVAGLGD
ncbi:class A beta-lactamase [Frondihabitans sp. PAMC 28766]|uniref:class A beta-lactamase n=1 Tax=Frondihabitans sp. PAMC 28766 TaxID=1795630 RepID=UPI00078DCCE1|nr:class A beta-lactamase [Frondihabitans sp. PAMC 28766]AMM21325.1 class A beta-lactamase [Frondihabitans sp. PAMC 28766]